MALAAPVFPGRIPTAAPAPPLAGGAVPPAANNIVPFRGSPSVPLPPSGVAPPPPAPAPVPTGSAPVPAPPSAPAPGVAAVPAAVAAAEGGAAASLVPVLVGGAAIAALDLLFPAPAFAPGIPAQFSPLIATPRGTSPISLPSGGIVPDAIYGLTTVIQVVDNLGLNPPQSTQDTTNVLGSNLRNAIAAIQSSYPQTPGNGRNTFYIQSQTVALLFSGSAAPTFPNYDDVLTPQRPTQPLQDPSPLDSEGLRRPYLPLPPPQAPPFRRPAPAPIAPPLPEVAPPVPPIPLPPVIPETPPEAPPYFPPVPYNPIPPVFVPPGVPQKAPAAIPTPLPPFLPVPTPVQKLVPPLLPPPVKTPTLTPPLVDEKGFFLIPPVETRVPPSVPPTERTRGADCCDIVFPECPPCDIEELKNKLDEIKGCACPESRQVEELFLGEGSSGNYSLPPESVRVVLSINDMSPRVRSQSGNAEGETIYFAGSYAFGYSQGFSDRKPISFYGNVFECPPGAGRFQFQLNYGSIAAVSVFAVLSE